jgi:4-hydroxyphenylpyruvate dioxygenase-like putative hemolysin
MADSFEKPMGLLGFEFVEFASPTPGVLEPIFEQMGFTLVARHRSKDVVLYRQGDINFIINREPKSFAGYFAAEHGPCACGMAFRVKDSHLVYERALALGAQPMELRLPAIKGIGGAPLYLISRAMTAPDGKIRIPLNEESGKGSGQIEEFLMQFNGEGIQHIALVCDDLIATMDRLALAGIPLLSAPNDIYYDMLETRLPDMVSLWQLCKRVVFCWTAAQREDALACCCKYSPNPCWGRCSSSSSSARATRALAKVTSKPCSSPWSATRCAAV